MDPVSKSSRTLWTPFCWACQNVEHVKNGKSATWPTFKRSRIPRTNEKYANARPPQSTTLHQDPAPAPTSPFQAPQAAPCSGISLPAPKHTPHPGSIAQAAPCSGISLPAPKRTPGSTAHHVAAACPLQSAQNTFTTASSRNTLAAPCICALHMRPAPCSGTLG